MKSITTYVTFDGTCKEAMTFYAACLDAELEIMPMAGSPGAPADYSGDRVMHAKLTKNGAQIMASDAMPGHPLNSGFNFSIAIECESEAEIDSLFTAFAAGGKVTMPLTDTFWGARFGMLMDKFSIQWMFNFTKPKP